MDDEQQPTFGRALRAPEFWLLVAAALSALAGVAWWVVVPLVMAGLSVSSLPKYIELWPRARGVGAEREWWKTVVLSLFNTLGAACAAFGLGVVVRWLWW